ncbi:hypothetical protein Shel_12920 [Slackia heliotrinireducens DSM 20476]|uniref:Uncharacterized protein n=1 Tax=Slackia heliotrinireducens (strain ATCC 29202 / DSM 20476 / NCTC 11029 / RHS 1) TaxID=471855 RepID=C7N5Y4_SLAHD|nr:hypothetical protein Shel_12920 [Slackia heliotrinireducens DSM 20476]
MGLTHEQVVLDPLGTLVLIVGLRQPGLVVLTVLRVPAVGADSTTNARMTRTRQLMNSTKPKKMCRPRHTPMMPGMNGKWMMQPEKISTIIATRLIQWVIRNGSGCASL